MFKYGIFAYSLQLFNFWANFDKWHIKQFPKASIVPRMSLVTKVGLGVQKLFNFKVANNFG